MDMTTITPISYHERTKHQEVVSIYHPSIVNLRMKLKSAIWFLTLPQKKGEKKKKKKEARSYQMTAFFFYSVYILTFGHVWLSKNGTYSTLKLPNE